ncbi:CDC27 protein [Coemansia sp. RSA 552]|nr:CDC27 protein [Coemansia sp. RSA 552]
MEKAEEALSVLVAHESQIVTYRRLSRELKVHVNVAKELLSSYYKAHQEACHATYMVIGTGRGAGDTEAAADLYIKLVPESELESAQAALDSAHCHMYSVGPKAGMSKQALVMANVLAGSCRDIAAYSAVGSSVTHVAGPKASIEPSEPEPAPVSAKVPDMKPVPAPKKEEPSASRTSPAPSTKSRSKGPKSFFGRVTGNKKVTKEPAHEKTAGQESEGVPEKRPEAQVKVEKRPETRVKVEKRPEADVKMEPAQEPVSQAEAEADSLPRVEDMFMDDDSDFAEPDLDPPAPVKQESLEEACQSAVATAQETEKALDVDMVSADKSKPSDSGMSQQTDSQSSGRRRVRKRRKVSKIKHSKNSRGMLVSQAVEGWESYSESESDSESRPRAVPVKRKAAGAQGEKGAASKAKSSGTPQRSILSFFGGQQKQI